jgi:hypothetical protein
LEFKSVTAYITVFSALKSSYTWKVVSETRSTQLAFFLSESGISEMLYLSPPPAKATAEIIWIKISVDTIIFFKVSLF